MSGHTGYFVYVLECADGTYYTGVATDVARRVIEHNTSLRGARYTKARRPVALRHSEACGDRSAALKREHEIKRLTRAQKNALFSA